MEKQRKLDLNLLSDFITSRIDESVGGICNIESELPHEQLSRNALQQTIKEAIEDFSGGVYG